LGAIENFFSSNRYGIRNGSWKKDGVAEGHDDWCTKLWRQRNLCVAEGSYPAKDFSEGR
jgi:hypothetical protein